MRAFVDTSALLALLDETDAHHADAAAVLGGLAPDSLVTHNYVVVEALALVRRRLGVEAAIRLVDGLLAGIEVLWIDEATYRGALDAFRRRPGGPSLVDQASFVLMRRLELTQAFAFDRDFEAEDIILLTPRQGEPRHRLSEAGAPYGEVPEGLVSVAEIARHSARPVSTIQSWRRRHSDFPRPIAVLAAGPVWMWADVSRWIDRRSDARASA